MRLDRHTALPLLIIKADEIFLLETKYTLQLFFGLTKMGIDPSAFAAWVALGVAAFALLVAFAQVLQQYISTGHAIRKCDKAVWGPMPGHCGCRTWDWRQFRFRIVYNMPNIFIPTEYWHHPGSARVFGAERIVPMPIPFEKFSTDADPEVPIQRCSEACWVSLTRQINYICPSAVRFGLVKGDTDRLPSDLQVVPMQVSLRDIIALGLSIGMTITSTANGSIEMSGASGFITSSAHPLLGKLLHFSAFSMAPRSFHKGLRNGDISKSWLSRLHGVATIAQKPYNDRKRTYYQHLGHNWRAYRQRVLGAPTARKNSVEASLQLTFIDKEDEQHRIPVSDCATWEVSHEPCLFAQPLAHGNVDYDIHS
jgi:hypothetical protein